MLPLASARARVLAECPRLHPLALPIDEVLGCVTSVPLVAEEAVPPFDNTAVDGYAVRAADTTDAPVRLRDLGTLAAGDVAEVAVGRGEALRIMTGAPLPVGADAVVMVEDTEPAGDGHVLVRSSVGPGAAVRRAGEDVRPGDVVIEAQTELGPAHLGLLASLGYRRVPVHPRARVGVLSTGDELVDGPGPLGPGQIRDSNRRLLLALLAQTGCTPVDLGLVPDDEGAITAAVGRGVAECDAVLTSGGVSMGDFDLVKVLLDRLGRMEWMQIAIRPAKPFAFGVVAGTPVFGLPGNPVSSLVSFELLARPALRQMMGHRHLDRPRVAAVADDGLGRRPDGKTHYVRVHVAWGDDGRYHARASGAQGSHQLAAAAAANGLAVVPDGDGVPPGGLVGILLFA
ncbi:MAG: molybdopterin molybdotransferase MoeA [Acidimicrobiales bacterium]|nr:molybdopterin molybdotransferase MoeA [Acidimicrobiales bacterium]